MTNENRDCEDRDCEDQASLEAMPPLKNTPSLGQTLRERRLEKGYALETISTATRIPERFLNAMEADCFEDLPAQPYASGFVRGFARYLDLPEKEILARFKCEAKPCHVEPAFRVTEPVVESRLPSRAMVFGGLITAVAAYSVWFSLNATATSDIAAPVLPDRDLAQLANAEQRPVENTVNRADQGVEHRSIIDNIEPASKGRAPFALLPQRDETANGDGVEDIAEETAPVAAAADTGDVEDALTVAARDEAIIVEVVEDAWIHVTRGEEILYTGVMKAGRRYSPEYSAGVELTTGNAGGVVLHVGEWSSGPLGQPGRVRRAISLDPQDWQGIQVAQDHS